MKPSKSEISQLYKDVPLEAYRFIAKRMGYTYPGVITNLLSGRLECSSKKFASIIEAFAYWKLNEQITTFNKDGIFDKDKATIYYNGLLSLIGSDEYKLIHPDKKNQIVDEQKMIYKQLTS
ncbi:MAG: hypothetical protein V4538_15480 [Bacteroidota bacterium]